MNYMGIYESLRSQEAGTKTRQQGKQEIKDNVQEQICNFFCEINLLMQDVYISMFKALFKRIYEADPGAKMAGECKTYIMQLFTNSNSFPMPTTLLPEVLEAFRYQDLPCLYSQYMKTAGTADPEGLTKLLVSQLIGATDRKLETSVLKAMIGYHLSKTEFVGHLDNLFVVADENCARKHQILADLMPQMADCLNQLASWLNVSDVKTLKQSALYLEQWRHKLETLISLFYVDEDREKKDERFSMLFAKSKTYSLIISFLKLTAKVKLEAATNVIRGNENLGLHAVTFSRELLKVIELSNKVLAIYCLNSPSAKQ